MITKLQIIGMMFVFIVSVCAQTNHEDDDDRLTDDFVLINFTLIFIVTSRKLDFRFELKFHNIHIHSLWA